MLVIQLWAREIQHPYLYAKIIRTVCKSAPSSSIYNVRCFALRKGANTLIPSSPVLGHFPAVFSATSTAELFHWFTCLFWAWKENQYHLVLSPSHYCQPVSWTSCPFLSSDLHMLVFLAFLLSSIPVIVGAVGLVAFPASVHQGLSKL